MTNRKCDCERGLEGHHDGAKVTGMTEQFHFNLKTFRQSHCISYRYLLLVRRIKPLHTLSIWYVFPGSTGLLQTSRSLSHSLTIFLRIQNHATLLGVSF